LGQGKAYRCGDVLVDAANRRFVRSGEEIALEPKVFSVILELLARPNQLATRDQLLDAVWGHRYVSSSTLNRTIVLARKAFGDADGSSHIQTVHGAGYRYTGPVEDSVSGPEPRAFFAPPFTARLPARIDDLIGREQEIARIGELLSAHRAVTVVGAGGMGKTRCALEFARHAAERYPDGVWFFDLAPLESGEEWVAALALALSLSAPDTASLLLKAAAQLAQRRALLVLDNCDRIAPSVGSFVVQLLRHTEHLQILATSQQLLSFVGERALPIPPLRIPDEVTAPRAADLESIAGVAAVELLLARIRATQPAFVLTAQNARQVVEICRMLDGMPLALELAASRLATLSPDQVLERLSQRFQFLVSELSGRDARHRTLHTLIGWSYSLLSPDEQRLLAWLGVFVRGWTAEHLEAYASAMGLGRERLGEILAGLVAKSLVTHDPTLLEPRYRLLESVRDFARQELERSGEADMAAAAHLESMRLLAQRVDTDIRTGRAHDRVNLLLLDHANIDAAIDWATSHGRGEVALDIAGSLVIYGKSRGALFAHRRWTIKALNDADARPSKMLGRTVLGRGIAEVHFIDTRAAAKDWLAPACDIARAAGDQWGLACASGYLAVGLANDGQAEEAEVHARLTRELAGELDDDWLRGLAGLAEGWVELARGRPAEAVDRLVEARQLGPDLHQRHFIDMYAALGSFELKRYRDAARYWRDGLRNALQVQHMRGAAGSVEGCAYLAVEEGRYAEGLRWLSLAESVRQRTQIPLFAFWRPFNAAASAKIRDNLSQAELEAITAEARAAREEDGVNEALAALSRFADG
jgi:predicted ATPase/DNA-binding winged helix-turn-helix (wHTH) protein